MIGWKDQWLVHAPSSAWLAKFATRQIRTIPRAALHWDQELTAKILNVRSKIPSRWQQPPLPGSAPGSGWAVRWSTAGSWVESRLGFRKRFGIVAQRDSMPEGMHGFEPFINSSLWPGRSWVAGQPQKCGREQSATRRTCGETTK